MARKLQRKNCLDDKKAAVKGKLPCCKKAAAKKLPYTEGKRCLAATLLGE